MRERCKRAMAVCFEGDVTIGKAMLWLLAAVCLLAGAVYGLMMAPWTHGVTIGCNNTSQNDCCFGSGCCAENEEEKK